MAVLKGIATPTDRKLTVETLLRQLNLRDVRKKMLSGFGGMRQRFGIAQALIGSPELIIAARVDSTAARRQRLSEGPAARRRAAREPASSLRRELLHVVGFD